MAIFFEAISRIDTNPERAKHLLFNDIVKAALADGYTIDDVDLNKPWGFYVRFESSGAKQFIGDFFPGLSFDEACLGNPNAELSPKILLVSPGELLSWQYHDRRAERWAYLTDGAYYKSMSDEKGDLQEVPAGTVVQFAQGERHRLVGIEKDYVLVAEIWQHVDKNNPSDEADIVRLEDKYKR